MNYGIYIYSKIKFYMFITICFECLFFFFLKIVDCFEMYVGIVGVIIQEFYTINCWCVYSLSPSNFEF